MKNLPLTLCLLSSLTLVESCKKEECPPSTSVNGNWELRTNYNGQGGQTDYQPGNRNILRFSDHTYERYSNGQLQAKGSYQLTQDSMRITHQVGKRIVFDSAYNSIRTFMNIENNRLTIAIDAFDGPAATYERK